MVAHLVQAQAMAIPILTTKLYIPPHRPGWAPRRRLLDLLNKGMDGRLVLVSAPAGFGKTSTVAEWARQGEVTACWLALDENDNDIGRFLAYFIASLRSIDIEVDDQLLALLQSPQKTTIENVLIPLVNELSSQEKEWTVVLDDYHLIHSQEVHEAVAFLLEHAPPAVHLVILTRADPPFPLARMRARGEMTEIRLSDLRFSVEECEMLLNQVQGLDLPAESIQTLIERADGWAAALQMIALALRYKDNPARYIEQLSGSQTYIADYLSSEVISQQPAHIRDFLLRTSFLERLSGPLVDAVTGLQGSQQVLKQLVGDNLFLTPLDDDDHWFHYHPLFASLLQQRLLESQAEILPVLCRNASRWCEEQGWSAEAIAYALQGGDLGRAAALIESQAIPTIMRSEINTFIGWVQKLPEEQVLKRPRLAMLFAWALLVTGDQKPAGLSLLQKITPTDERTARQLDTVRSMAAAFEGHIPESIALSRRALEQLPPEDAFFRNIAAWNLSGALAISGDAEGGLEILREVVRTSLAGQNYMVAIVALCRLGTAQALKGRLPAAKETFEQAIEIAASDAKRPLPAASEALMGLGRIEWEWNRLEKAGELLEESIQLSKRWRENTIMDSYIILAHILQTQGETQGANQMLAEARKITRQTLSTQTDDRYVASHQAHLALRQGDLQTARGWAGERRLNSLTPAGSLEPTGSIGMDVILRYELIVFARMLIAEGQAGDALHALDLALPLLERMGFVQKIIEVHILRAEALHALGEINPAVKALKQALDLARPGGYTRIFIEEGQRMVTLLEALTASGKDSVFARELLAAMPRVKGAPATAPPLIEPLSERELEILRLLDSQLSGPEIADRLHISVTTLRTHTRNIYGKLGVHGRFEAITRGKQLNIT